MPFQFRPNTSAQGIAMETTMADRTDIDTDSKNLMTDPKRLEYGNTTLRQINVKMLDALNCALPILRDGLLPVAVNSDSSKDVVVKVKNAVAEGERDR
jgi:hypothetical protein